MATRAERGGAETITEAPVRAWPMQAAGDSRYSREPMTVTGGAARPPGAAILASVTTLTVGAVRLALAVGRSFSDAVAVPASGAVPPGFLARELCDELPGVLVHVGSARYTVRADPAEVGRPGSRV